MKTVSRFLALTKTLSPSLVLLAMATFTMLFPEVALADDDKILPYQEGIDVFRRSMSGPVPFVISLVGIIGCGAMLIFGGEISGFMRTMVFIILVVAVIVQAGAVVKLLGGDFKGTGDLGVIRPVPVGVGSPA